jgi:hypothetical protein
MTWLVVVAGLIACVFTARFGTNESYLYSWSSTEWVNQPNHTSNDQMSGGIGNLMLISLDPNATFADDTAGYGRRSCHRRRTNSAPTGRRFWMLRRKSWPKRANSNRFAL